MPLKINLIIKKIMTIELIAILSIFNCMQLVVTETFDECEGIADGSYVANTMDCTSYIYCNGDDSMSAQCEDGEYFDVETLSCDAKENVFCPLDFVECIGIDGETFVPSSTDCSAYVYCNGYNSMTGQCPDGEYFNGDTLSCDAKENVFCPLDATTLPDDTEDTITTTKIIITTTTAIETTTSPSIVTTTTSIDDSLITDPTTFEPVTIPPIIKNKCPMTDDPNQIILMANNESCSDYYLCYHGQAIEMHCTNHLHFNSQTGKCDFPENVHCLNDRPNAKKCLPHITDFFPHPENCNYFYYCIKGFITVQQCPFYYGWDIEKRSCVQISQAKCFSSAKKNLKIKKR